MKTNGKPEAEIQWRMKSNKLNLSSTEWEYDQRSKCEMRIDGCSGSDWTVCQQNDPAMGEEVTPPHLIFILVKKLYFMYEIAHKVFYNFVFSHFTKQFYLFFS